MAGVIIWIGSRLGRRTIEALLDVAPQGLRERISNAVDKIEGVLRTERVRVRRAGQRYFVDVTISVPRTASLEQAHAASDAVERSIEKIVPADVVVHMEPRARSNEPIFETIRAIAQRRGLAVHELSAHQYDGNLFIEMHLEVDENSSLREAHRCASELEEEIRGVTSAGTRVNIHIEPLGARVAGAQEMKGAFGVRAGISKFASGRVSQACGLPRSARAQRGAPDFGLVPLLDGWKFADYGCPRPDRHAGKSREGALPAGLPLDDSPGTRRRQLTPVAEDLRR